MIACPSCAQPVAANAKVCPHCGRRSPAVPNALQGIASVVLLGFWLLVLGLIIAAMVAWMT